MNTTEYFTINDVAAALGIGTTPASKVLAGLPFELKKSPLNHKMQRVYHRDVVIPACVKYKKNHTIPNGWLTAKEASLKYKIHNTSLARLARKGILQKKVRGRFTVYCETELAAYAQSPAVTSSKLRTFLQETTYLFNQMKEAFFIDKTKTNLIDPESIKLFKVRRANLISKLNEL